MDWNNQPLDMARFVADQVQSMNKVALAGMKSGQQIGRIEAAARISQLEKEVERLRGIIAELTDETEWQNV